MYYKKLYKKALERARRMEENSNGMILKKWLWNVFPELAESEDERIRKDILAFIKRQGQHIDKYKWPKWIAWLKKQGTKEVDPRYENLEELLVADNIYQMSMNEAMVEEAKSKAINALSELEISKLLGLEKQGEQKPTLPKWKYKKDNTPLLRDSIILNKYGCVAKSPSGAIVSDVWVLDYDELAKLPKEELEKQCEQKPTKEVKSKFKVGDWVVFNDHHEGVYQIEKIENFQYTLRHTLGGSMPLSFSHEDMIRLWTIQDTKNGDVLASGDIIFIFNKVHDIWINCHCSLHRDDSFYEEDYDLMNIKYGCEVFPANKEQRDLLFAKIRDTGYVWDAKTKELKKIEPDVQLTEFEEVIKDMMNDYRDAIDDYNVTIEEVKEKATYLLSLIHQDNAWCEEDEKMFIYALDMIEWYNGKNEDKTRLVSDWLKSIKNRIIR